jgi:cytochrome c oxidase subunit II
MNIPEPIKTTFDTSAYHGHQWHGSFWLPPSYAPEFSRIDTLFNVILYITIVCFIAIVAMIIRFVWKYKRSNTNQRPADIRGHFWMEVAWIGVPMVIFTCLWAVGAWDFLYTRVDQQDGVEFQVTAHKWDWSFTDMKSGSVTSDLIVPLGAKVKLLLTSTDVIHGFYVPDLRINRAVVPGQYQTAWFNATELGVHAIECSQYCGTRHSQMVRFLKVVTPQEYEKAMADAQGAGLSPAELGEKIFKGKGACTSCHSVDAAKTKVIGPPLYGSFGEMVATSKGPMKFDENYIRQSILNPSFRDVIGYPSVMPPYQGQLKDPEVDALVAYLKKLGK